MRVTMNCFSLDTFDIRIRTELCIYIHLLTMTICFFFFNELNYNKLCMCLPFSMLNQRFSSNPHFLQHFRLRLALVLSHFPMIHSNWLPYWRKKNIQLKNQFNIDYKHWNNYCWMVTNLSFNSFLLINLVSCSSDRVTSIRDPVFRAVASTLFNLSRNLFNSFCTNHEYWRM